MGEFDCALLQSAAGQHWQRIGVRPHHGFDVPLFSLHSKNSCGIGEYPDLIPLIQYLHEIHFDVLQLLPLNDLGCASSPYSAISAFALNPIHLGLHKLPYIDTLPELRSQLPKLQELTKSPRVDYPAVYSAKEQFLHAYIDKVADRLRSLPSYQDFEAKERDWLDPYARFKTLKIKNKWSSWLEWHHECADSALLSNWEYHKLIQFLCFEQMKEVKQFAASCKVFLMGDIPILLDRESADVWYHRSLFDLDKSAGAPPDMYAAEGQNWGSPLYKWDVIAKDNYRWWRRRLEVATACYDMYRVDHIVGFFRIWAIPQGKLGHEGGFVPENTALWIPQGKAILEMMMQSSPMLPIGEDLGQIPPEVRVCMKELGICGTKVMRWERYWNEPGQPFIPFDAYIPESLTTVSTHDSETVEGWWQTYPEEAKVFASFMNWPYSTPLSKQYLCDILHTSHQTSSLFHINLLQEYLSCIPGMHYENPSDERVNVPGLVSSTNWSYRFIPSIEQIIESTPLRVLMNKVLQK